MKTKINKLRKQLVKRLEKVKKECVDNSYDPSKRAWNPKHFKYCEADMICRQLDLLDKLEKGK